LAIRAKRIGTVERAKLDRAAPLRIHRGSPRARLDIKLFATGHAGVAAAGAGGKPPAVSDGRTSDSPSAPRSGANQTATAADHRSEPKTGSSANDGGGIARPRQPRKAERRRMNSTELIPIDDVLGLLPAAIARTPELARAKLLRMSRRGAFPVFVRAESQKATPVFNKQAVMAWIAEAYGPVLAPPPRVRATRNARRA